MEFYRRYMYHAGGSCKIVESQEELDGLGPEWGVSPQAAAEAGKVADVAAAKRASGPTLEEYVEKGYLPENYPPDGYDEKPSAGLDAYRAERAGRAALDAIVAADVAAKAAAENAVGAPLVQLPTPPAEQAAGDEPV